eukprot:5456133-Alexandrium_andersonii.AAC.1
MGTRDSPPILSTLLPPQSSYVSPLPGAASGQVRQSHPCSSGLPRRARSSSPDQGVTWQGREGNWPAP